ncbi:MAG: hypothetical protein ACOYKE_12120 [Ferruginibacter sp.]
MKRRELMLACTLFTVFFTGCQKELSEENGIDPTIPITPPTTRLDSNFLSKVYMLEFNGTQYDTIDVYTYNYDNLKRMTAFIDSTYSSSGILEYFTSNHYSYNASDTLPFKTTELQSNTLLTGDTSIIFHFYDNLARRTKDSIIELRAPSGGFGSSIDTTVKQYSYASNSIIGFSTRHSGNTISFEKDTALIDANGNLSSYKSYLYDPSIPSTERRLFVVYTFDNKPSPFSKQSNFVATQILSRRPYNFFENFQKNNLVTEDETIFVNNSPFAQTVLTYAYSYNSRGYVTEAVEDDGATPVGLRNKYIFVYKAL